MHKRWGLPLDWPALRLGQALAFGEEHRAKGAGSYLRDVHLGLPASGVVGGTLHLVRGSYHYFHYMQVLSFSCRRVLNAWQRAASFLPSFLPWISSSSLPVPLPHIPRFLS